MKRYSMPSHMPDEFPFIDRKMWEKPMTDRDAHRAAVDAGYSSLAEYIKKWGDDKMDIVEQLRKYQCPENKGCNPVVEYCQCALMDSGADEIERLRENCFNYPALLDNLPHEMLMALHDHIHTIMDERNGGSISQARKVKAKKARSALQQKESE